MGVTIEQVNAGALDTSKLVNTAMGIWDRIHQSISPTTVTPPIAQTTTAPAVADRAVVSAPSTASGLSAVPWYAWAGLALAGVWIWRHR